MDHLFFTDRDFEYDYHFQNYKPYDSFNTIGEREHYTSMGETPYITPFNSPFVYYAQVEPDTRVESKKNPNGFVKAFRWYTKERDLFGRHKHEKQKQKEVDVANFATWLDNKYEDYLREQRYENAAGYAQLKTAQTSTQEANIASETSQENALTTHNSKYWPFCYSASAKSYPRRYETMTSPGRKRRRPNTCRAEGGSKQSCEFILLPKDVSAFGSELCAVNECVCSHKSDTTLISTDTKTNPRMSHSQSNPNIKSACSNLKKDSLKIEQKPTKKHSSGKWKIFKPNVDKCDCPCSCKVSTRDVLSQFPEQVVGKISKDCQADDCICLSMDMSAKASNYGKPSSIEPQMKTRPSRVSVRPTMRINNNVQTSDCSLHLDTQVKPFFLKVLCVEKNKKSLCDERCSL